MPESSYQERRVEAKEILRYRLFDAVHNTQLLPPHQTERLVRAVIGALEVYVLHMIGNEMLPPGAKHSLDALINHQPNPL